MIITAPAKNGDVVCVKLANGEEVIGRLREKTETKVVLTRPVQTQQVSDGQNGFAVAFGPFLAVSDAENIPFHNHGLLTDLVKVQESVAARYLEMTNQLSLATPSITL